MRDERADLAAFFVTLSAQQWEVPSLCDGWRVCDVVEHVISYDEIDGTSLVGCFARGRFLPDRVNAVGLAEYGTRSPKKLLALLNDHPEPHGLPAASAGIVALVDGMIHHQEIQRRPAFRARFPRSNCYPCLRCAFDRAGFWRVRGLRLMATDPDWPTGTGPEVHGPAEALPITTAGQRGIMGELTGPGPRKFANRIEC
jgi:uncharacterized protein (TIGR03083 family)